MNTILELEHIQKYYGNEGNITKAIKDIKYRFSVLRKLGVEEKHIGKLILQQLSVWFGLPIITAIIVAAVVIAYFIQTISAEISAYIGFSTLMLQIGATMGILAILLICYFISTWIIFRRSVNP